MVLRILRFLAVLAVGLFALRALAHESEKDVGLVLCRAARENVATVVTHADAGE